MKKFAMLSLSIALLVSSVALLFDIPDNSKNVNTYAEEEYQMILDSTIDLDVTYRPFEQTFSSVNYNSQNIQFSYLRCLPNSDGLLTMAGDGYLYNKDIDNTNGNSLSGMSSITVNYNSLKGKLYLSYGFSSELWDKTNIEIESGVAFNFNNFNPSHFKLCSLQSQIAEGYNVEISSIVINYHSDNFYEENDYSFTNIFSSKGTSNIPCNQAISYNLEDLDIGMLNFIEIPYKSNVKIKGLLTYLDKSKDSTVNEPFFLEASSNETSFRTFLDAFRNSAQGKGNKILKTISFTNVEDIPASFYFGGINVSNRKYSRNSVITISDSMIEVGVSLRLGGSICSVRNMNLNIKEYVDNSNIIKIRSTNDAASSSIKNVISNNPNLTNIFDVGREIQQSWYMNVDSEQGYTRQTYNGSKICYNPVQAGDQHNNESQIVDYKLTYDKQIKGKVNSLWIKVKALDWAQNNCISSSYMENTYSVNNGLIKVWNRFVDWSGWQNYENSSNWPEGNNNINGNNFYSTSERTLFKAQELPAIYVAHPLNYFASVADDGYGNNKKLIFDNTTGWDENSSTNMPIESDTYIKDSGQTYKGEKIYVGDLDKLKQKDSSYSNLKSYYYAFRKHSENWLGFFNEDKFGLATYMPANAFNAPSYHPWRHVFMSGQYENDHSTSPLNNKLYLSDSYEKQYATESNLKDSAYVMNTNYMTTVLGFYVPNYSPIEYTYAIGADYLDTLRNKFSLIDENEIYNDFTAWKGAEI